MSSELQVTRRPQHIELLLNRPAVRNALSHTLVLELTAELNKAAKDAALRAVIVTGAPPAFCAGLDLNEVAAAGQNVDNAPLLTLFETIENLAKPVIAAVNGPAVAGGAALASVCDVAISAAGAWIAYPGIKRGLVAPIVMSYLC
ncbi:MAG TPA: enoyl-CoA hydratase/isomerase family protein, partial [Phycisphaerae bacterium]|nr:enoyl-CoA hydratase/isomerase family protein [Phycisphaerae bacterium]